MQQQMLNFPKTKFSASVFFFPLNYQNIYYQNPCNSKNASLECATLLQYNDPLRLTRSRTFGKDLGNINGNTSIFGNKAPLQKGTITKKDSNITIEILNDSHQFIEVSEMEDITVIEQPNNAASAEDRLREFHAKVLMEQERELLPFDRQSLENPQACGEYAQGIYKWLRAVEMVHSSKFGYMKNQTDINEKMRGILIDWLVEVHLKFKLLPETLFLTVNLIDRYLEKELVTRQKLQLVGVSAMLIASKYEEIYAPEVNDFVFITDKAYTKEQILSMEQSILSKLAFNVTTPSSVNFLERYAKLSGCNEITHALACYLNELTITEYKMLKYLPSTIAASSLYLSQKIMKNNNPWGEFMVSTVGYTESDIKSCAKELCMILQGIEKSSLQAIKKKYLLTKYHEIAKIKVEN